MILKKNPTLLKSNLHTIKIYDLEILQMDTVMSITSKSFSCISAINPLLSTSDPVQPLDLIYETIVLPFLAFHINSKVCSILWLTSFTEHNALRSIFLMYVSVVSFCCQVVFHCMDLPQLSQLLIS